MYIKMPNNYTLFLNNGISKYDDRLKEVNKLILDNEKFKWTDYFYNGWLRERIIAGQRINMTKSILDKCATYLLMGQFKESDVLTLDRTEMIRQKEIPIASASASVYDLVYGGDSYDENEVSNVSNVSEVLTTDKIGKDEYNMSTKELEKNKNEEKLKKKRWKQTKTHKLNKLFSTKEIKTYRTQQVLTTDKSTGKKLPVRTLDGRPVFDVKYTTIGGNKGLVGLDEKYVSKWCIVDTNNNFDFMGVTYRISDSVEQYKVDWYNDNKATMDKILCIYIPSKEILHVFDENINQIDNTFVTIL